MKAQVTWKGEEGTEQKEMQWGGKTFKKGEAVEITDPKLIEKAQGNDQFFDVNVTEKDEDNDKASSKEAYQAPSNTMSPQHASPKPGERVGTQGAPTPPRPAPKS